MNATNVRKLATAESKRDTRQPVTSNAGIFGSLLTQAVGRNDASKAMKTLEGDAKLFAKSQAAIEKFNQGLAMDDRQNALAGNNLGLYKDDLANQRAMDAAALKEQHANRRHNQDIAQKNAEMTRVNPKSLQAFGKEMKGIEASWSAHQAAINFMNENPEVDYKSAIEAGVQMTVKKLNGFESAIEKAHGGKEGSTATQRLETQDRLASTAQAELDALREKQRINGRTPEEQALMDQLIADHPGLREDPELVAYNARLREEIRAREAEMTEEERITREAAMQNGDDEYMSSAYNAARDEVSRQMRAEGAFESQTEETAAWNINPELVNEATRKTLKEKEFYYLAKNALFQKGLKIGATTTTDSLLAQINSSLGMVPGSGSQGIRTAFNISADSLVKDASQVQAGFFPEVVAKYGSGYPGSVINGGAGNARAIVDPSKQETTPNVGVTDPLEKYAPSTGVTAADELQHIGAHTGAVQGAVSNSGAGGVLDIGTKATDKALDALPLPGFLERPLKKALGAVNETVNPKHKERDTRGASNLPMDIFKTPKNEGQANVLAHTIAILQSQSQLGQRNA